MEHDRAAGNGGHAVPGDKDAGQVHGIGAGNRNRSLRFAMTRGAKAFHRIGKRELLPAESGDKSAAADFTAVLEPAQHAKQYTPLGNIRFARDQVAEHDAVAREQHAHGGFDGRIVASRFFECV